MTSAVFPFRFQTAFELAGRPLGIRADTARVEVAGESLTARFGPWRVHTALSNITSAKVTGPYWWPKVIGPPHVSLKDRGLTFGTNRDEGVCIRFARPVGGIDPLRVLRHPALTVTVEDSVGLAELLDRARQHPERVHTDAARPTVDDLVEAVHDDLRSLSAAELRRRAKERGIPGASRRSKAELVELLEPDTGVGALPG